MRGLAATARTLVSERGHEIDVAAGMSSGGATRGEGEDEQRGFTAPTMLPAMRKVIPFTVVNTLVKIS